MPRTWNRRKAHGSIKEMLGRINQAWTGKTSFNGVRFRQCDELLASAISSRDLDRVMLICSRYEKATIRDIEASAKQPSLF